MKEIPAFTVLKNNSILKNIFLLQKQQSSINQDSSDEQILLVGRHPNCNITLEHPSISRYHLRIHSNPSSHSLSVYDLSSVHGTWVCGNRIEPGVHVELKEGDTVKMGGSSRVYELHWVPVSRSYDDDDDGQFMSTIYMIKEEMNQDEKLELHLYEEAKKRWTMVVDTSSLLHAESLKHLKLLEGLKGTQIVIPKIVIRELMDIHNQDNISKRNTENVSFALKWIDECMVNTRWWMLMDDEILQSSELESQVLETALHLRKEITDRKIIILSNDLTLKIRAMAEGIMCEAAEEFHRSLVNPFSERFMWVGSSAIGLTWSSVNDDILRQKYHGCSLNGSQGLKGCLKLLAGDTTFCQEV